MIRNRCCRQSQPSQSSLADLSPIHPSEPSDSQHAEESLTSTACRDGPALNSTFLSPKQPEEEELPTALENAGQPEEEQAPAPPTVFQPFITPTSAHTRTDSEEHKLEALDLFDQLDLQRPEPISAREEEIQKRIYLKRHFFLEGVLRRWATLGIPRLQSVDPQKHVVFWGFLWFLPFSSLSCLNFKEILNDPHLCLDHPLV